MFIGPFAARKFAPRRSEAVLLTAPLLADVLWPVFLLLGWEQVWIDPGNTRLAGAIAIWIGVVSHWVLDWVTHRPEMPLYPGGARYGLGLWNSIAGTIAAEVILIPWAWSFDKHRSDKEELS